MGVGGVCVSVVFSELGSAILLIPRYKMNIYKNYSLLFNHSNTAN